MAILATLTTSGRAAIAAAIAARPLHLAWGTGDPAWDDMAEDQLPGLVDRTALFAEVGRRATSVVGFAEPDEAGGIVVPVGRRPDGTVEEARYRQSTEPTPYIYMRVNFDFADACDDIIREMGIFMDTQTIPDLPPGQLYFKPDEIENPGRLLAVQILDAPINRSMSVRQTIEFVLPI